MVNPKTQIPNPKSKSKPQPIHHVPFGLGIWGLGFGIWDFQNVVRNPNCAVRGWKAMFESYCGWRKFVAASLVTKAL